MIWALSKSSNQRQKRCRFDEYVHQVGCTLEITPSLSILNGAFDFSFYSPGTGPERIPYHLYLLLKEAVYIMSNTNDEKNLKMVEEENCFFMTYFHSHLPPGFRYKRHWPVTTLTPITAHVSLDTRWAVTPFTVLTPYSCGGGIRGRVSRHNGWLIL
ncbi:hypothetical protein HanPI659440_Chr04g0177071 [Helianthus annuus]|nr:hypothetical protein HanPI659440_Chr04g0177071 [Helianthus annuus]